MDWILIAVVSGSIIVSGHSTEEACLGRAAMLKKDQKIEAKCVSSPTRYGSVTLYDNGCRILRLDGSPAC